MPNKISGTDIARASDNISPETFPIPQGMSCVTIRLNQHKVTGRDKGNVCPLAVSNWYKLP